MNQIDINDSHYAEDELHEECGVFGVYDFDGNDVCHDLYQWWMSVNMAVHTQNIANIVIILCLSTLLLIRYPISISANPNVQ